ncbi:MAG: DNA repair exonuclease [Nanoarchaeota archaeon]
MEFAHLSDVHLGGWKDKKLTTLGLQAFETAIKLCIENKLDFILIAGDLFNTAIPPIDIVKDTARILKKVNDHGIPVYAIPGSHDFSAAGKTMLDVFEEAGLLINVMKYKNKNELDFVIDKKTGVKLAGFYGKKGGLEKFELKDINKINLEKEDGFKIFLFHTGIYEFMPLDLKEKMESSPRSMLPKNFSYYGGGHIHYIFNHKEQKSLIAFPGALFPNSFKELEEFKTGGMYIADDKFNLKYIPITTKIVHCINIEANNKTPEEVTHEIVSNADGIEDKIVLIRIHGELASGKISDINFVHIYELLSKAYVILRNTTKLQSRDYDQIKVSEKSIEELETELLAAADLTSLENEHFERFAQTLMHTLNLEKLDGEKNASFEDRVIKEANSLFEIEL